MSAIIILASKTGWHTDQLEQAVRARGMDPVILPWEALVAKLGSGSGVMADGIAVRDIHGVLPRIIPNGSLEQIIFRVDLLHRLEAEGTRVMNSARAIERSVDKAWTSALLEQAGLPTPDTVVCERSEDAFVALREMGDVVVKPLFGSMGLGMMRVSDEDTAFRVFRAIEMTRGVFYLQRFIPHDGADIRAFVVGDKVIGAIYRSAPGWKTNVSRGGTARPCSLDPVLADLAVKAAQTVGAEYAGVDLLPGRDGAVYVLEVNGIPGWQGLHEATGSDVAGAIVGSVVTIPPDLATLAQLSCLLEVSAPKPGNVSPGMRFRDMSYEDFLVSALAIGPALSEAGRVSLGVTIERALAATRQVTSANTNLGLVLLLTPLAAASTLAGGSLRQRLQPVLRATTIEDARLTYNAIRSAKPGGMGNVADQDLAKPPDVTLLEAMALAKERDTVAREYVTDFEITFVHGAPALRAARKAGLGWLEAVTEAGLILLSEVPDTLIARKAGEAASLEVSGGARAVLAAGGVRTSAGRKALAEFDASLRDPQNSRNPGTTADLTAAATFVTLLEDGWNPT